MEMIRSWLRLIFFQALIKVSERRDFDTFKIYSASNDESFFDTVIKALEFLKRMDAHRYARAEKHLRGIAHVKQGINHYELRTKMFYVHEFDDADPAYFASQVVHEATHGYLSDRRFRYKGNEERHESICVREQFAFIKKAINQQKSVSEEKRKAIIEEWQGWFQQLMETKWWQQKNLRRERIRALQETVREWSGK